MGNKVSFIFVAQDRYSRVARAAAKATQGVREQFRGLRSAIAEADARLKKFNDKAKKFGEGTKELGARAFAGIVLPLGYVAKSMVDAARDAEETRSKFATVFSDISGEAESTADALAKNFGLAGTKARQLLGDTGDLLSGFGFTGKEALAVSKQVNELAVDLASFTNYAGGAEGASAALTKGLLGERESMKSLGIAISEENVKQEIAILMAQGRVFHTERQAKAHATLSLAMKQSKNAIGDYARTSQSLANQERKLTADTQNLAEEYGRLLVPIKLVIVQGLSTMFQWLGRLSPETKKWVLITAGAVLALGALAVALGAVAFILPTVAVGAALLLSPFLLIPAAIAAVVAGAVLLYQNFEPVREVVDGVADAIGEAIAQIQEFSGHVQDLTSGAFANVADFFGFGGDVDVSSRNRTDVNVNLRAPQGAVESVKRRTTGNAAGLNVGVNMVTAGG